MCASPSRRHEVAVLAIDQMALFEFAVPCEVFGVDRRDLTEDWYGFRVVAAEPPPLRTNAGVNVAPAYGLDALTDVDTVIVPAWPLAARGVPSGPVVDAVREAAARGARVAAVCSGAFVLAEAGLLDGRRATTHWMNSAEFARRYPRVRLDPGVLYIDEGDVLTSAGTAAGIDLCLHMVRKDLGAEVANGVARRMVVPPHRDGGQAQFIDRPLPAARPATERFAEVLEWMRAHLDETLTVEQLARRAAMSPRSFARHFRAVTGTTPLQWLTEQRLHAAQRLLETTDEPVERVASLTGFGTPANLRKHFHRYLRTTPQSYRRTFRRMRLAG